MLTGQNVILKRLGISWSAMQRSIHLHRTGSRHFSASAQDSVALMHCFHKTSPIDPPTVHVRGDGIYVYDQEGKRFVVLRENGERISKILTQKMIHLQALGWTCRSVVSKFGIWAGLAIISTRVYLEYAGDYVIGVALSSCSTNSAMCTLAETVASFSYLTIKQQKEGKINSQFQPVMCKTSCGRRKGLSAQRQSRCGGYLTTTPFGTRSFESIFITRANLQPRTRPHLRAGM